MSWNASVTTLIIISNKYLSARPTADAFGAVTKTNMEDLPKFNEQVSPNPKRPEQTDKNLTALPESAISAAESETSTDTPPILVAAETCVEIADKFNPRQLAGYLDTLFLEEVLNKSLWGEITSFQRNQLGEKIKVTVNPTQLLSQMQHCLEMLDANPANPNAYRLVPRIAGLRQAVDKITHQRALYEPFKAAVLLRQGQAADDSEAAQSANRAPDKTFDDALDTTFDKAPESEMYDFLRQDLPPLTRPTSAVRPAWPVPPSISPEQQQFDYYSRFITAEHHQESVKTLRESLAHTPELTDVVRQHGFNDSTLDEAVVAIREDPAIRFDVARILFKKINILANQPASGLGQRIVDNDPGNLKTDPQSVLSKKLPSRLYAVKMALKMIGGEFAPELVSAGELAVSSDHQTLSGQHVDAARAALNLPRHRPQS